MVNRKSETEGSKLSLDISNRVIVRVMLVVILTLIALAAVRQAAYPLTLIFTAFFLSLALNAPVHWIAQRLPGKRKGSRTLATAISFLVVVVVLAAFLISIVPPLIKQTSGFIRTIPQLTQQVYDEDTTIGRYVAQYNLQDDVEKFTNQLSDRLDDIGGTAISGVQRAGSSLVAVLTVLVLTFMMLVEGPRWQRLFMEALPDQRRNRVRRVSRDMYKVIKGYVNGQVTLALIAALAMLPVLLILNVPYPTALVFIVFIAGLIPLVGHTVGAIVVTLVALFESPLAAIIVLAYYILYQQIENYVVQPRVQANTTNMSPLLVFGAVVIGVSFGGLLGGLVAIPVAGCIRVALLDYLSEKNILQPEQVEAAMSNKK